MTQRYSIEQGGYWVKDAQTNAREWFATHEAALDRVIYLRLREIPNQQVYECMGETKDNTAAYQALRDEETWIAASVILGWRWFFVNDGLINEKERVGESGADYYVIKDRQSACAKSGVKTLEEARTLVKNSMHLVQY